MRVLYFGTYSLGPGYPRNRVLIKGLRRAGVEVAECHVDFWSDASHKVSGALGGVGLLRLGIAYLKTWWRLTAKYLKAGPHDLIMVGYTGQIDVFLARFLGAFTGRPVVLDAFLSLHDTLVRDRGLVRERSIRAKLLEWLDRTSCRLADLVLLDTRAHARFFQSFTRLPKRRFAPVLVGEDDAAVRPAKNNEWRRSGPFRVLWFGTYVPLQGVRTILAAAHLLQGAPIEFRMIGTGQGLPEVRADAEALGNVRLVPQWVSYRKLNVLLHDADVCLGIFGTTEKAGRVIPCKVYDALAAGRPLITADTPAARELLVDRENALLVEPGSSRALADAIVEVAKDEALRLRLGESARRCFTERASPSIIGRDLAALLRRRRRERFY